MDKKLILIAEDEAAYGKILKNGLQKEGYAVILTLNGDELLEVARAKKPVLIVLDLRMPVKNGFEVLAEMKKDKGLKNIKVVALSNLSQEEDVDKAKKLGVDEYIVKSDVTFHNVIEKIHTMVS